MLTFRVFGTLSVRGMDGQWFDVRATKQRILLATLLLRGNEWVSSSRLIDALWPEKPPKSAVDNLKTYVWRLRVMLTDLLGDNRLQGRPGGYRLEFAPDELDLSLFEELAQDGRQAWREGRHEVALGLLTEALQTWRGEPFDDVPAAVVDSRLAPLHERHHAVRELLVQAQLTLGQAADALPLLRGMLVEQPLREKPWAQYISALVQADRRAEAVAAYREVHLLLGRELGLEPGPAIRSAYQTALTA